jgi:hypothetical protein
MLSLLLSLTACVVLAPQEPDTAKVQAHPQYELMPPQDGGLPLDSKDNRPVIIGPTTAEAILEHRPEFREAYEKLQISPELIKRWSAIETPFTFVVVFGSWCGDSHHWVPELIKLSETPNPFISVYWIGTYRDKTTSEQDWPPQTIPQKTERVATFWLFAPAPGGETKLVGGVVENPPQIEQTMAEALMELLDLN